MDHRPSMTALAVALLVGIAPTAALAADSAADSKYTYRPYSQQNQAGSDAANSPANNSGSAAARPDDAGTGTTGERAPVQTYRGDARPAPEPGAAKPRNVSDRNFHAGAWPSAGMWIACAIAATMPSAPSAACRPVATRRSAVPVPTTGTRAFASIFRTYRRLRHVVSPLPV